MLSVKIRSVTYMIVMLALMRCATPYQEDGFLGGVSSFQLSENVHRIVARGNAYTPSTTLDMYTLWKASELALSLGFDSFYFISEELEQRNSSITSGGSSNTYGNVSSDGTINATTNYDPPTTTQLTKFVISKDVYLVNKSDFTDSSATLYDAEIIRPSFLIGE